MLVKFIDEFDHHYWSVNVNDIADDKDCNTVDRGYGCSTCAGVNLKDWASDLCNGCNVPT